MPVHRSTVSSWTSGDNDIIVSTGPVRLKAVEIAPNSLQSAAAYLRLWNSVDATPGTTEPDIVIPILVPGTDDNVRRIKVILGGLRFPTGLTYGLYTTPFSGSTAPTVNLGPLAVQVFYNPVP